MEKQMISDLDARLNKLRATKNDKDVYKLSTPKDSTEVAIVGEPTELENTVAEIFAALPVAELSYTRIYKECEKKGLGSISKAQVDAALFKVYDLNPIYDLDEIKNTATQLYGMRYGLNNYMFFAFNKRFDLLNTSELMVEGFIDLVRSVEESKNLGDITEFLDRAEEVVDPDEGGKGRKERR